MARPFRFSAQATGPLHDLSWINTTAVRMEQRRFAALFSFDHIGAVDPFAPLLAAGIAAGGIEVGPLVLNNELHHPVLLARTAATIDSLLGGRLVVGFGTGYQQSEHDAAGIELRPPAPRVRRLAESLEIVRSLLDTGAVDFDGEFHHVSVADLGVRPVRHRVPFLIGGHGRALVSVAARFADIFQFTGLVHGQDGTPTPAGFALEAVRRRAAWLGESERNPLIERSALIQVSHVGRGADAARADIAQRFGVDPALLDETPFVLIGSLEQVIDKVERLRAELGISHFVVREIDEFAAVVEVLTGR